MTGWLRDLADKATFGEGHDGFFVAPGKGDAKGMWCVWERLPGIGADNIATVEAEEHARLIALAPELAKWCADAADAIVYWRRFAAPGDFLAGDEPAALLARLDALAPGQTP